jgi:hypothetical protein
MVEIKKNLIIFRNPAEWEAISARIVHEYGPSIMISWKCRRKLGFTVRHHKGLVPWETGVDDFDLRGRYYYEPQVHLDWYDEGLMSFFMLKYLG